MNHAMREQAIRERAYAIWEEEGRPEGKDREHWLRAEVEINSPTEQRDISPSAPRDQTSQTR
jgi:Protein of unknown function (DUF2934)